MGTATTEIYTLSLHDALPILEDRRRRFLGMVLLRSTAEPRVLRHIQPGAVERREAAGRQRSEEHTSELQSPMYLVCRLLLEKKNELDEPNLHHGARVDSVHAD